MYVIIGMVECAIRCVVTCPWDKVHDEYDKIEALLADEGNVRIEVWESQAPVQHYTEFIL